MTDYKAFRQLFLVLSAAAALIIAGCASTPSAPVEDRSARGQARNGAGQPGAGISAGSYRVRSGDTLYSIAFRNGMDYRELAQANRIAPPFTIYVGQIIQLGGQAKAVGKPAQATNSRSSAGPAAASVPAQKPTANTTKTMPQSTPAPAREAASTIPPAPAANGPSSATASSDGIGWRWPADGVVVAGFLAGDQTRQGINISGTAGAPVRSSADGEVVYSGNGLIGYGELIIVKHNASMLSAYGHNRRRLVQEGDRVKAGQQIAEMGSSSASRDMLHFEIRKNGKPVDPINFLPRR